MTSIAPEVQYLFAIGENFGEKFPPNIFHSLLPSSIVSFFVIV